MGFDDESDHSLSCLIAGSLVLFSFDFFFFFGNVVCLFEVFVHRGVCSIIFVNVICLCFTKKNDQREKDYTRSTSYLDISLAAKLKLR